MRPPTKRPPTKRPPTKPKPAASIFDAPKTRGLRIGIYGTGGIGKTTLAMNVPGSTAFVDLDESLRKTSSGKRLLQPPDTVKVANINSFKELIDAVEKNQFEGFDNVVIDSISKFEDFAVEHVIKTIPHEKGYSVKRLEDYGYGKGSTFLYETMLKLFVVLDLLVKEGQNIVMIAHECKSSFPNPFGEDFLRYEPRMYQSASGKNDVRNRWKDWLDYLFFIGYDISVKDSKARGSGTRTIYTTEKPFCMAKSRGVSEDFPYNSPEDNEIWKEIF